MNEIADSDRLTRPPVNYWWLWVFNAALVSGAVLCFLAPQYGTHEFLGVACLMALLPFIPIMVLLGGAGSTLFALTRVLIEKRRLNRPLAVALLVAPALAAACVLGLSAADKSPARRLALICLGNVPASASHVQVAGYSTFLKEEWLAVFNARREDFQTMVAQSKLEPVDEFDFSNMLKLAAVKDCRLFQNLPPLDNAWFYKRVFNEGQERQRGSLYAVFDPATSTAVLVRECGD